MEKHIPIIKASSVFHANVKRIKVDFTYNIETTNKLKQISDLRWSKSLNAWHIPYTKEAFEQLNPSILHRYSEHCKGFRDGEFRS